MQVMKDHAITDLNVLVNLCTYFPLDLMYAAPGCFTAKFDRPMIYTLC